MTSEEVIRMVQAHIGTGKYSQWNLSMRKGLPVMISAIPILSTPELDAIRSFGISPKLSQSKIKEQPTTPA